MKKLLPLLLALALVLSTFVGCAKPGTTDGPGSDTPPTPPIADEDYDEIIGGGDTSGNQPEDPNPPVDDPPVNDPPETEAPENSQVATGFVAKQKKYDYGENNIIMLNVTNQNADNYSVTVEGYYLDADGQVLKTETKFVEGYAAGYVKDFLFNPGIAFDSFKFTLTAEKFSGECYEDDFYIEDTRLRQESGYAMTPEEFAAGFEKYKPYPCLDLYYTAMGYTGTVLSFLYIRLRMWQVICISLSS